MSTVAQYADVENLVKQWLLTTSVAPLLVRTDGGTNIFLAMPASAPMPAVVLSRVGGGSARGKDLPEEVSRISFACWASTRSAAGTIYRTLMGELESLARIGGYRTIDTLLAVADVTSVFWLPDPDSDRPRYIVDALITTLVAA